MSFIFRSDRPFRRTLVKLACRLLGDDRAHFHSWLPWLKIAGRTDDSAGAVLFREEKVVDLQHIDVLRARSGGSISILGSGPSIKGQDLSLVPDLSAILLNGAISLIGQGINEPLAVAIEDERFVWRHFDMIRDAIGKDVVCLLGVGVLRALCEIDRKWLKERLVVLLDDVRKPYGAPRRTFDDLLDFGFVELSMDDSAGFSADPDKGVFQGGSVAISALQFAIACAPEEIGFLGVDISNANSPRFYERAGNVAFSGIAGAEARILFHIALARHHAEQRGIRLVNHSPVSALRSIGIPYRPLAQSDA